MAAAVGLKACGIRVARPGPLGGVAAAVEGSEFEALARLTPILKDKSAVKGRAAAYVCENGVRRLPSSDPNQFEKQLAVYKSGAK